MDETKLTKQDKEELKADAKELLLDFAKKIKELIDELADKIEKC